MHVSLQVRGGIHICAPLLCYSGGTTESGDNVAKVPPHSLSGLQDVMIFCQENGVPQQDIAMAEFTPTPKPPKRSEDRAHVP